MSSGSIWLLLRDVRQKYTWLRPTDRLAWCRLSVISVIDSLIRSSSKLLGECRRPSSDERRGHRTLAVMSWEGAYLPHDRMVLGSSEPVGT